MQRRSAGTRLRALARAALALTGIGLASAAGSAAAPARTNGAADAQGAEAARADDVAPGPATGRDEALPTAPARLDAAAVSSSRVELYWGVDPDPAAVAWVVLRDGAPIARTDRVVYSDEGLQPGSMHVYAVRAVSASGMESPPSASQSVRLLTFGHAPFSFAILPDTQFYSKHWPESFDAQTRWIRDNTVRRNIVYTFHVGDIVNDNSPQEWERASASMSLLDGVVPYAIVPGNHDMGPGGLPLDRDTTLLNRTFPASRFEGVSGLKGTFEKGRIENSYHVFEAGGIRWIVVALEYGPRDAVVKWANQVLSVHKGRRAILLTHAYLYGDGTLQGSSPDHAWNPADGPLRLLPGGVNDGAALWEKLVRRQPTLQFVFSGHVLQDSNHAVSKGDAGNPVYQLMSNYQHRRYGGNGFLQLIEIDPRAGRIEVSTYSPLHDVYMRGEQQRFVIDKVDFSARALERYLRNQEQGRGPKPGRPRGSVGVSPSRKPGATDASRAVTPEALP